MNTKKELFDALMNLSQDGFYKAIILLECQNYLHRVDLPSQKEERFKVATAVINEVEKIGGGLEALKKVIKTAIEIQKP
jgi:hypothetical protein